MSTQPNSGGGGSKFVVGMILGLVIGLLVGAFVPPLLDKGPKASEVSDLNAAPVPSERDIVQHPDPNQDGQPVSPEEVHPEGETTTEAPTEPK